MKTPSAMVRTTLAAWVLAGMPVFGGSFTTDFSTSKGLTPGGTAFLSTNRAILTWQAGSLCGGITLDDLDAHQAIEAFTATFKLQLGPGSGAPADGVSFNFGPDIMDAGTYSEEGPAGPQDLTISFDTYNNGGAEAPALDIKFGGSEIAHHPFDVADMVTCKPEDVSILLTRGGYVSVAYKGQIIHTNVIICGWAPVAGRFNISGRTGGEYEEQDVSSLSIATVVAGLPPTLTITRNTNGSFTLTYTGTLYSSPSLNGTYMPVSGASSPWTVNPKASGAQPMQFYRAGM